MPISLINRIVDFVHVEFDQDFLAVKAVVQVDNPIQF